MLLFLSKLNVYLIQVCFNTVCIASLSSVCTVCQNRPAQPQHSLTWPYQALPDKTKQNRQKKTWYSEWSNWTGPTKYEPRRLQDFRPRPTQTDQATHVTARLETWNVGFREKRDHIICVAKTKELISFTVSVKLFCLFVFAYAKVRFLMTRLIFWGHSSNLRWFNKNFSLTFIHSWKTTFMFSTEEL